MRMIWSYVCLNKNVESSESRICRAPCCDSQCVFVGNQGQHATESSTTEPNPNWPKSAVEIVSKWQISSRARHFVVAITDYDIVIYDVDKSSPTSMARPLLKVGRTRWDRPDCGPDRKTAAIKTAHADS